MGHDAQMTEDDVQRRPLVAVVTPVYNGAEFLEETLASVQAQSYPNLVHVVLDNASTDATAAIIDRFRDGPVPLVTGRNPSTLPAGANWSAAAAMLPDDVRYFSVLCADDTLFPDGIEQMVSVAESDATVELVGGLAVEGNALRPCTLPLDQVVFDGSEVARRFLDKVADDIPHHFGLFLRRPEDFVDGFFDGSTMTYDTHACLRSLARGAFGFVHRPVVYLRVHPGQLRVSHSASRHSVFESLHLIDRWAPVFMSPVDARRCRARQLRSMDRYRICWRLARRHDAHRRLDEEVFALPHNASSRARTVRAVLEWPFIEAAKRRRRSRATRATTRRGFGASRFATDLVRPTLTRRRAHAVRDDR
jgi:glycosyltransferase involved in cell wall biosynthesis